MTANDPALAADDYGLSAAHKRMPLDCCHANQCRNRLGVLMHSSPVKSIHSRCKSHWISRDNRSASDDYVHSCFFKQRDIAVACLQYQSTSLNAFVATHQTQIITHTTSNIHFAESKWWWVERSETTSHCERSSRHTRWSIALLATQINSKQQDLLRTKKCSTASNQRSSASISITWYTSSDSGE